MDINSLLYRRGSGLGARGLATRSSLDLLAASADGDERWPVRVCFLLGIMAAGDGERAFRFCPRCGGAFDGRILKAGDPARLVCDRCGFVFYLDPKVAVGTIIRTGDHEIVLCRRAIEPGYGRWVFPGGYVDRGEKLEDAAVREAREECGLDVELERTGQPALRIAARRPSSSSGRPGRWAASSRWPTRKAWRSRTFAAETIPWDDLAFESTGEALRAYFEAGTRGSGLGTRASRAGTARRGDST